VENQRAAVTVVIPAQSAERWHTLVRAVASARSQTTAAAEVVVVVDHNPRLFHRIRRDLAGITVLQSEYLPGAAGARNTGAFHAQTSLIAFLDDDTVADPGWLSRLLAPFGDPDVVGTGASVTPEWTGTRPRWLPDEFLWAAGGATAARGTRPAGLVVRRDPFRQVGGFGTGGGTSLYARMTGLTGGRWTFLPDALVRHQVPGRATTFGSFLRRCYTEGRGPARMPGLRAAADLRTLPRALARNLSAALRGEGAGHVLRAGGVLAGMAAAGLGTAIESVTARRAPQPILEPAR
jgi:glucosyl-dolichyl phosphate glucuronosyltransferase